MIDIFISALDFQGTFEAKALACVKLIRESSDPEEKLRILSMCNTPEQMIRIRELLKSEELKSP